jgi:iron complex outermembrane receptor protein
VAGSPTLYSYVQNVGRVSTNGAELVSEGLPITSTLSMSGSVTLVDAKVKSDRVFAAAVGKRLPQLPRLRSTLVATWRPSAAGIRQPRQLRHLCKYLRRLFGLLRR